MRKLAWGGKAWKDYLYWQSQDKKTLKRINQLIQDTLSHPFEGILRSCTYPKTDKEE